MATDTALRMHAELKRYSNRIRAEGRLPIQARVGVNTGEVVVRSITTGEGRTEYAPVGHSTGIAARMQTLAPVGSIAATEQVRKLCEGYFLFESLGPTKVKGVSEPLSVYEVTGLGPLRTRLQLAAARGYTKFVGREREMEALRRAAEQAKAGLARSSLRWPILAWASRACSMSSKQLLNPDGCCWKRFPSHTTRPPPTCR